MLHTSMSAPPHLKVVQGWILQPHASLQPERVYNRIVTSVNLLILNIEVQQGEFCLSVLNFGSRNVTYL